MRGPRGGGDGDVAAAADVGARLDDHPQAGEPRREAGGVVADELGGAVAAAAVTDDDFVGHAGLAGQRV